MPFLSQLDREMRFIFAAVDLQAERKALAWLDGPQRVSECRIEVHLSAEKAQRAVVDFEGCHAARPPPVGVGEVGAAGAMAFGLVGAKMQPDSRAWRRVSKIWKGFAAAGWTCRVAVVCMAVASLCGGE